MVGTGEIAPPAALTAMGVGWGGRSFGADVTCLPSGPSERHIAAVTDSDVLHLPFPDARARDRIASDLEANLLVEAGAGSGKTTALVGRLVTLISTGTATVDQLAAVTFTRKAASELRERFQTGVELALSAERAKELPDDLIVDRLSHALDDIDRAFIGTIHSFCGRLLRERPLDVGLDPGFEELPVEERVGLRRRFWESYLERLARDSDPRLEKLSASGLRPASLYGLFDSLVENDDVDFPTEASDLPTAAELAPVREELEAIVDTGWELMDDMPPARGWDSLQRKIRQLHFERGITGWKETTDVFGAVALLCKAGPRGHSTTLKNWRDKALAKALRERVDAFGVGDTRAHQLVGRWYAHRYALAIDLCRAAVREFAAHRMRIGKLDFQDLLTLAARLLRGNPEVRQHLGERYRRLLVDEFQDTDPLQAEIMMLLSSAPSAGSDGASSEDWRSATPRPGALFVVGDPKQSIYRFRRADIQLYGWVKERFRSFGEVLSLSTNFRSRPCIGDVVNQVFCGPGFFPEEATPEQAAFERLDTRPPVAEVPREGVFVYDIEPDRDTKVRAAADDGSRIAAWIRDRVDGGEREPQDFLILTWGRGQLAEYARAIESHGLPVSVTGAGIGVEEEIHELQVLLRCMIDPTNPVQVVASLTGLFFGLDYERLTAHRLAGGGFDAMWPGEDGHPDVVAAMRRLHGWWRMSVAEPADVFVARVASELGLLPYAAAGDLGTLRAGALLYALDSVRAAALSGDTSLPGALDALQAALNLREAEAPLEPGRPDAVRLMNLHQAKGLEGTVVVLADPTARSSRRPELHMTRSEDGEALGYLRVPGSSGIRSSQDLARPIDWAGHEDREQRFEDAEDVRLLYVAVTRAREELVVARWPEKKRSAWEPLHAWLHDHADVLVLEARDPAAREELELAPAEAAARVDQAAGHLAERAAASFVHETVTSLTKARMDAVNVSESTRPDSWVAGQATGGAGPASGDGPRTPSLDFRGYSWGSAVHGALAFAAEHESDADLRGICRNLLVEHGRPLDDHGEPTELRELIGLVRAVQSSPLWTRAREAKRMLTEISFALPGLTDALAEPAAEPEPTPDSGNQRRQLELFGPGAPPADGAGDGGDGGPEAAHDLPERSRDAQDRPKMVLEGVIDLAFRERGGWVIADYKTDVGTDPDFPAREAAYRRQVDLYAEAWSRLTGEPVKERVLFFTAQDRVEQW